MEPATYDISVRELAEFVHRRGDLGGSGGFQRADRALEGIKGHKRIQQSRGANAGFTHLSGALEKQAWCPAQTSPKKAYLAGPFFSPAQLWMVEETRRCLISQGIEVFSPYHEIGLGEPKVVAPQNIEAMSDCDLIFALLDGQDAGTLFEVGYARSIKKRVIAYHTCENKRHLTMLEGSECGVYDNFVSAIYSAAWEE